MWGGGRRRLWRLPRRGVLIRLLLLALAVPAGYAVRLHVLEGYYVPTPSMEPTLHGALVGGDRVLVDKTAFWWRDPRRWEVAVFRRPGRPFPFIKRVVGVPGDVLWVMDGDVYSRGRVLRKPPAVFTRLVVPLFTSRRLRRYREFWEVRRGRVRHAAGGLLLEADGAGAVRLCTRSPLEDGFEDEHGVYRTGRTLVNDVLLQVRLRGDARVRRVALGLGNEHVAAVLACSRDGLTAAVDGRVIWRRSEPRLLPGGVVTMGLAYVDRALYAARKPGRWERIAALPGEGFSGSPWRRPRGLAVRVVGGAVRLEDLRVERDLHYGAWGRVGVDGPVRLGPGQFFVLGDNSSNSSDSRDWGPVTRAAFVGRPLAVVWPPSRWRLFR